MRKGFCELAVNEYAGKLYPWQIGMRRRNERDLSEEIPSVWAVNLLLTRLRGGYNRVLKSANAADADLHNVADVQWPYAGWRSGGDHVAWQKRHDLRDPTDQKISGEHHLRYSR